MRRIAMLVLTIGLAVSTRAAEPNQACALLTTAELEAALGATVSPLAAQEIPGKATVQMCTTKSANARVLLRIAKMKGGAGSSNAAAEGIEVARQMGAQVDVKTFGPITCSTMIPPKNMEQMGFNTTCSVVKGTTVAAVEITTKARKDLVPIEKVHPLAGKIAARVH